MVRIFIGNLFDLGSLNPGEEWDDGGTSNGDGWSELWQIEPKYEWVGMPSVWNLFWGNGKLVPFELKYRCFKWWRSMWWWKSIF